MYIVVNKEWSTIDSYRIENKLENRVYSFEIGAFGRLYLREETDFTVPTPLFDFDKKFREIVLDSYNGNYANTGVVLSGLKGTGKSVCARLLCKESNLPVIMIKNGLTSDVDFKSFFSSIKQDFILFIDEFEKLFPISAKDGHHGQDSFLSIMDGITCKGKILFLFTVNENINTYMLNRPSRVKFLKTYNGLTLEEFEEISKTLLQNQLFIDDLKNNVTLENMTIDVLTSIIKEVNIQNKPYSSFKSYFNYSIEVNEYLAYKVTKDGLKYLDIIRKHISNTSNSLYLSIEDITEPKIKDSDGDEYYPYLEGEFTVVLRKDGKILVKRGNNEILLQPVPKTFSISTQYAF
jgi:replication-associated recombination protein RarA